MLILFISLKNLYHVFLHILPLLHLLPDPMPSSLLIQVNVLCFFFSPLRPIEFNLCCLYNLDYVTLYWSMINLLRATAVMKTDSRYLSISCQLLFIEGLHHVPPSLSMVELSSDSSLHRFCELYCSCCCELICTAAFCYV